MKRNFLKYPTSDTLETKILGPSRRYFYEIPGIIWADRQPFLTLRLPTYSVSAGDEWRVWFSEVFAKKGLEDNAGVTCYQVDVEYIDGTRLHIFFANSNS